MKSFALHLIVVFIIGTQYSYYNNEIFCSSTSSLIKSSTSSIKEKTKPYLMSENVNVNGQNVMAHDHHNIITTNTNNITTTKNVNNFLTNNTRTILKVSSSSSSSTAARYNSNNGNNKNNNNNNTGTNIYYNHQQQRQHQRNQRNHQHTTKTPRTIQRLVGGHLQHATENRKSLENNNKNNYDTTTQLSKIYFRRKPSHLRNTYRSPNQYNNSNYNNWQKNQEDQYNEIEDLNSDAALLEDPREFDNWDNGILRSSAGAGKENTKLKKKEDSKKTLADQVRDGKYGLIEKELFQNPPKRPGIISYLANKEVPNDNKKNFGGLNEEEIWLAEDHLLVLKGGGLNENNEDQPWEPIDDYQAPSRQIKIPANPKVPPPFPVQLEENGPIQFIGNNKFSFINSFVNESLPFFAGNGYIPSTETNGDNEKNIVTGTRTFKNSTNSKGGYFYPAPNPPWLFNNQTFANPFLNLPIGKGSLDNSTDYIDEDDPSLYYPPPYSFVYESNYSSPVPPGPLVPGIILPPPPNAFAKLEDKNKSPSKEEIPFRQILTKISEYKPKTVVLTTVPPPPATTLPTIKPPTTTILYTTTRPKDIVFAITKPAKKPNRTRVHTPSRQYIPPAPQYVPSTTPPAPQTSPPEFISFVPKGSPIGGTSGKGNPIYYEYFDARKVPNNQDYYNAQEYVPPPTRPPVVDQPLPQSQSPQSHHYDKVQITTSRPVHQPRLSKSYLPTRPFSYDDYIYITPKPEIRPNGVPESFSHYLRKPTYKPIHDFDREIEAIRQTLDYYKTQQLQHNIIPRVPRPKAVYEYSFDATKSSHNFQPPLQVDEEPFKPMVKYSPPIDDVNGFKAIPYAKSDEGLQYEQDYYLKTSTPNPIHKPRIGQKSYIQSPVIYDTTPVPDRQLEYSTNPPHYTGGRVKNHQQPGWVSVEKQIVQEIIPQTVRVSSSKHRTSAAHPRNIDPITSKQLNGYYYHSVPHRQNNRYYQIQPDDGFTRQVNSIKTHLRPYKLREPINLENDTYVNYAPNRPPIHPDAEFIHPQPLRQQEYYQQQQQKQLQQQPIHSQMSPLNRQNQIPRLTNRLSSYQTPVSLHSDTLVNYRQPLPSINPDAEYIHQPQSQPQIITRNHHHLQYRQPTSNLQRLPNNEQTGVYYFPSRDLRYTNRNGN